MTATSTTATTTTTTTSKTDDVDKFINFDFSLPVVPFGDNTQRSERLCVCGFRVPAK